MLCVFASSGTKESGEKLGYDCYTSAIELVKAFGTIANPQLVRWGNSQALRVADPRKTYNKQTAISLNANKLDASRVLGDVVRTPRIFTRAVPHGVDAVCRPIQHAHGVDFTILTGPASIPDGMYGAEWIRTDHEYRVWFAFDKMLAAYRTQPAAEETSEYPCRSKWNYEFCGCGSKITQVVKYAKTAIGLDLGAADILSVDGGPNYVVLELNSAPSLDHPKVLRFFQDAIIENTGERPDERNQEIAQLKSRIRELRRQQETERGTNVLA